MMELHYLFYVIKYNNKIFQKLDAYVGKPNSMFKSLEDAEARYCNWKGSCIKSLESEAAIERYIKFMKSDFRPQTTVKDVLEVIYFDYPKLCSDLINACEEMKKREIEKPTLVHYFLPILRNKYVPPHASVRDILHMCVEDEMVHFLGCYVYGEKQNDLKIMKTLTTEFSEKIKILGKK